MLHRREFLTATAGLLASPLWLPTEATAAGSRRPKIAFLGTVVKRLSHAQHFLDRMTEGYTWNGTWQAPRVEVAGLFIDQSPAATDLSADRIRRHHLKRFPTISETLTLGGEKLAVDGIVLIGEHGQYPENKLGQTLYPRYKWFKEVTHVFADSGRSVPIFNDKHLSTSWPECVEMVEESRRLNFPFLAGSSLPVTWRLPAYDLPLGADLTESVCVAYGGVDSYDFHALETAQCMSERRRGGEVGINSVQALRGEQLWKTLDGADREVTRRLIVAALTRSHSLPTVGGFPTNRVSYEWFRQALPDSLAYLIEHRDGFRTTIVLTGIRDFNYAGHLKANDQIVTCQMYLPMPGQGATTADFFNPLTRHIEQTILDKRTPYPIERTLLTSGMVIGGVKSLHADQKVIKTPEMEVVYQVDGASHFWNQ